MQTDLLNSLKKQYPNLIFKSGKKFLFHPPNTIVFNVDDSNFDVFLLHELGHALLKHSSFKTDIDRLKMEVAAWQKAQELASLYQISIHPDFIEDQLDTYRNWLHQKSLCKKCGLTRYQTSDGRYHCPFCQN